MCVSVQDMCRTEYELWYIKDVFSVYSSIPSTT